MEQTAITPVNTSQQAIELVKSLMGIVTTLRHDVFVNGVDYGTIPGTNDKPVLLLPGMEKLMRALRLRPEYHPISVVEDFDKPLFMYRYECRLIEVDSGLCTSSAIGSANSYEQKWRYRTAARTCPECGKPTIIKGRAEYGGGWLCHKKQGGCGAKFPDGAAIIEQQEAGRIENDNIFDQINTIDKIAQKRALSSAIKGAANVSQFFTVDLDDTLIISAPGTLDMDTGEIITPPALPSIEKAKANLGPAKKQRPAAPPPDGYSAPEPPPTDQPDPTANDIVTYVEVRETAQGKPYIVAEGGLTTFTRDPFRKAGVDCESWTTPGEKHVLDKPLLVRYVEKGDYKNIVEVEAA